jgi:CheY-like chemotaxis protein
LAFECETDRQNQPLFGDGTRLKQALLNYAGNAVKFTDRGVISLRASLVQETDTSALWRFEVKDGGIGIAPETLGKLFTAFEQGDSGLSRKYSGTGLGLAITKRLAVAMGGDAGAQSSLGQGSTFWFTAWLEKGVAQTQADAQDSVAPESDPLLVLQQDHAGSRVLLVDDDLFNQEIGRIVLEDAGLSVDVAEDGHVAVAQVGQRTYHCILMDMQMPGLDGLSATRQIRLLPEGHDVPIIAMTANAFSEDRLQCLQSGMNDFITKPLEPQIVYAAILRWLEANRARAQANI